MTCDEIREVLGRWYDGELEPPSATAATEHVQLCPTCRGVVDNWRRIDVLLEIDVPADDLATPVLEAMRRERRPGPGWWLTAAAAVLAALALGLMGGRMVTTDRLQTRGRTEVAAVTASVLEESFAPGAGMGFDDLAADLEIASTGR